MRAFHNATQRLDTTTTSQEDILKQLTTSWAKREVTKNKEETYLSNFLIGRRRCVLFTLMLSSSYMDDTLGRLLLLLLRWLFVQWRWWWTNASQKIIIIRGGRRDDRTSSSSRADRYAVLIAGGRSCCASVVLKAAHVDLIQWSWWWCVMWGSVCSGVYGGLFETGILISHVAMHMTISHQIIPTANRLSKQCTPK